MQHVNRMPHSRLSRIINKLQTKRQKKPREANEETVRDREGATNGPTACQLGDDDVMITIMIMMI